MQHNLIRDVRFACSMVVRILEPADKRIDGLCVGLLCTGRRHHAPAQLTHGLLEHLGAFADILRLESFKTDTAGLGAVVVTTNAALVDRGQLCLGFGSCWSCLRQTRQAWTGSEYCSQRNKDDQCDEIICDMSHIFLASGPP